MTDHKLTLDLDRSSDYPGDSHAKEGRRLYNIIDWTGQHRGQIALTYDEWAALNPLRPRSGGAADAEYLDRFPPEARPHADRAYEDGYVDAGNESLAAMERARDLLQQAIDTHIYAEGDAIPEDCPYTAAVAELSRLVGEGN